MSDEQLGSIPAKRGVVLLESAAGKPILLISAADIRSRLRSRLAEPSKDKKAKRVDLRKIVRMVRWKLSSGHFETDLCFFELARLIWPDSYAERVAWRPAWFVHVNVEDACPYFRRTRKVFDRAGRYFGPFGDGRAAERFVEAVQDAFGLCRRPAELRKAPRGHACVYAQMGRCLRPCDGGISMGRYKTVVAKAADFTAGRRGGFVQQLRRRMKAAAKALRFEQAADMKALLNRLAELDAPAYGYVAPAEDFRFVLVQPGRNRRQAKTFLVHQGRILPSAKLDYPLRRGQLCSILKRMADTQHARRSNAELARWRMGLVAHYLFCSDARKSLILRWRSGLKADELAEAIELVAGSLKLQKPTRKKRKATPCGKARGDCPDVLPPRGGAVQ